MLLLGLCIVLRSSTWAIHIESMDQNGNLVWYGSQSGTVCHIDSTTNLADPWGWQPHEWVYTTSLVSHITVPAHTTIFYRVVGPQDSSLVTNVFDATNGLVAHYRLNGNILDSSGNDYHGTAIDTSYTYDRFWSSSAAVYFDGDDDYLQLPSNITVNSDMTVSFWLKAQRANTNTDAFFGAYLVSRDMESSLLPRDWRICLGEGTHILFNTGQGTHPETPSAQITSITSLSLSSWYHVAAIVSASQQMKYLYINGVLEAQSECSELPFENTYVPITVGRNSSLEAERLEDYNGMIDDIRIYNRPLSDAEVYALSLIH